MDLKFEYTLTLREDYLKEYQSPFLTFTEAVCGVLHVWWPNISLPTFVQLPHLLSCIHKLHYFFYLVWWLKIKFTFIEFKNLPIHFIKSSDPNTLKLQTNTFVNQTRYMKNIFSSLTKIIWKVTKTVYLRMAEN